MIDITYYCIFCWTEIEPEEIDEGYTYQFECQNKHCQAIYRAKDKQPSISIYHGSNNPDINLLRNEDYELQKLY
jgi:hypothetical protein